jgi:hypothetical protein
MIVKAGRWDSPTDSSPGGDLSRPVGRLLAQKMLAQYGDKVVSYRLVGQGRFPQADRCGPPRGVIMRKRTGFQWFVIGCALICRVNSATALPPTDFDGDGRSDLTTVTVGADQSLSWQSRDSASGAARSLGNLGTSTDTPIVARWLPGTASQIGVASLRSAGSIGLKILDSSGQVIERMFGVDGDLVVAGARFDGNETGDAAAIRLERNKAIWLIKNDLFVVGDAVEPTRVEFGAAGDRVFFGSPGGGVDWIGVLRSGSNRRSTMRLRNLITGEIRTFNRWPGYASTGARPRPIRIPQDGGGADLFAFQITSARKTEIRVIDITGRAIAKHSFAGTGVMTVGDYFEGPGYEIAFQTDTLLSFYNPVNDELREVSRLGGSLVDEETIAIIKSGKEIENPGNGGSNDDPSAGGGSVLGASCRSLIAWPGSHIYKTRGSEHFSSGDPRRTTIGVILKEGARGPFPSCLTAVDTKGRAIAKLGLYARGAGWAARYYAGWGCGASSSLGGAAVSQQAKSNTGTSNIVIDFGGGVCFGPIDAGRCYNSSSC